MAQASRTGFQVLTANRLGSGEVVYARPGGWTLAFEEAEVFACPETAGARLKAAATDVGACRIVEPYLFDVEEAGGACRPVSVREAIRAGGPSIAYGKSAVTNGDSRTERPDPAGGKNPPFA